MAEVASTASGTRAAALVEALPDTVTSTGELEFIRKRKKLAPSPASKVAEANRRWPGTIGVPFVGEILSMLAVVKIRGLLSPESCHELPATSVIPGKRVFV